MEASDYLKIGGNAGGVVDVSFGGDSFANYCGNTNEDASNSCTDGEEDEESLFDLVLKSPDSSVKGRNDASKKDVPLIESPRVVFLIKNRELDASSKAMSPISLLQPPPKLKGFRLGFKKIVQMRKSEPITQFNASPMDEFWKTSKFEQRKCKEEVLHMSSVFARDNSLRSKMLEEKCACGRETTSSVVSPEKLSRDSVRKYLKLIKPLYAKVSKRQNEKQVKSKTSSTPLNSPLNVSKLGDGRSIVGSFKVVARYSGQSRYTSAAQPPIRRRDDSLLEQHNGIQGAILHCKESYNSSSSEYTQLLRFGNYTSHEYLGRNSCEETKRCSI
ncbi:putative membrane-associated kinase regulator 2-like [Dorcoceras hygrometricum]|uniref:Putative membrane-associated kinase regulator 2-like n=1 Tax=Dorcoceras hygrometricum TaxID=472368 RepID=A0A2Z7C3E0_9LAMI|nr:putative membrane-associated kinase regulator 2-like [Dorcoceras hygrometricum]